ncbi:MAG: ATP-binding protein [Actinomycetota bacterium]|nr:ATP-binding protein [Actinomycetota bacterium]
MRPSVRLRLTLVYGALFLLAGAILLGANYALVRRSLAGDRVAVDLEMAPGPVVFEPQPHAIVPAPGRFTQPLPVDGSQVDAAIQEFEQDLRDQTLDQLLVQSAQALAITAVAAVALGWVVAGRILRPLQQITGAAQRLSEENLHERIAMAGPDDELKELADTFDSMLARLDTAFEGQRRFAANAAHELRTPLAIMRTEIDVALADPQTSASELRDMAGTVLAAIERTNALLDGLLMLARSDRGSERLETVDLADLVVVAVDHVDAERTIAGVTLEVDLLPAPVLGDPVLLQRLADNLVENAVRHNRAGGWLELRTGTAAGRSWLTVRNSGPPVPAESLDSLFEPFRRGTPARTGSVSGAGLGLSIVRSIATAHGASITPTPIDGGGLEITVELPVPG